MHTIDHFCSNFWSVVMTLCFKKKKKSYSHTQKFEISLIQHKAFKQTTLQSVHSPELNKLIYKINKSMFVEKHVENTTPKESRLSSKRCSTVLREWPKSTLCEPEMSRPVCSLIVYYLKSQTRNL